MSKERVTVDQNRKEIVASIQDGIFLVPDSDVLIKPLPPIMVKVKEYVLDEEKNKGLGEEDEKHTKEVEVERECIFRTGVIIRVNDAASAKYSNGMTIVYRTRQAVEFPLIKDAVLLKAYDIIGEWLEPKTKTVK